VEYDATAGDGRTDGERKYEGRNYARGRLIGLITDRDIVIRAVAENKDCASTRAEDIMSVDIATARPNDRVVDVIQKMGNKQVRRIPVVNENGYLVGNISMADVAVETHNDRELSSALEDISKGSSFWNRIFG
jgi:CBS domain-containing protein